MLKKFIFLIFLTYTTTSIAQFGIHIGGGANFSDFSFDKIQLPEINKATNYFISVRPEIGLSEGLSVGIDLQFSRKGYDYATPDKSDISGYRFQYLDLIPQAQFRFIKQVAIYGGLGIAIRTSEKYNISEVWKEATAKLSKSTDFTYVAGLRLFPISRFSIETQFAGSLGSFLDVEFTDVQGNPIPNVKTHLNNIQIGIAYQLY
jgi:hypothetical protein